MNRIHFILGMLILLAPGAMAATVDPFAAVKGVWLTQDKDGAVELYSCGGELCGKFYWLKPSTGNDADRDENNPDPQLRRRPLCGMQFMGGFKPDDEGEFTGGWIYSPRHGAKFSSEIRLQNKGALELRGYMLVPILGDSQIWTKADNIAPCQTPHDYASHANNGNRT